MEFLPESVLARTERLIAWWTPPQKRLMFFGTAQGDMAGMNGAIFPQPALVWMAMGHSLWIRALKENRRPTADTRLCVAPYWNVYDTGSVCLGSMRAPDGSTVASIPQWERSFYESEFTHGNVGRLTRHSGGFEGLWKELAGQEEFPADSMIDRLSRDLRPAAGLPREPAQPGVRHHGDRVKPSKSGRIRRSVNGRVPCE